MLDALNDTRAAIRDMARQFSEENLAPHAAEWDAKDIFPVDVLKQAAELGFAAIPVREDVGGSGLGRMEAALIFEELSRGCVATAAYLTIHNMVATVIDRYGSDDLRHKVLPDLASMKKLASYCLTEPNAGSDAASLQTRAMQDGDDYLITGSKAFISGGSVSDVYLVMARTGAEGPKGISAFLVDGNSAGLSFGKHEDKLGWRAQPTTTVMFDAVRVSRDRMVGALGDGFKIAMQALDGGRINIAACSIGGAQFCLDQAIEHVTTRQQFGAPLSDLQAVRFKLADMATNLEASRLMVYRAAEALDAKSPEATKLCAMAKRFATDTCFQIVDDALQLFGGYGYLREYPIERVFRDLRVHRILEGTNDIMRVVISREMLKGRA
jgi:alkylation response protein AidB-like acyl-CoA dehydrogenase